jgi:hypothetical protein
MVYGLGLRSRVWGLGFRVWDEGFRVKGSYGSELENYISCFG